MFDIIQYLRTRNIDFEQAEGWINIQCPVCRSAVTGSIPDKKYLGFNLESGYFHCWRCGKHEPEDVVMALERYEYHEACGIVMDFQTDHVRTMPSKKTAPQTRPTALEWPACLVRMMPWHRHYLTERGFDPDFLEWKYGLLGTIDCGKYANRVMAPIYYRGRAVSYQGRDITGKHPQKYKACRKDLELIHHKDIFYNLDNCLGGSLVVVEGIVDVWRLGDHSCATFGTRITPRQIALLASMKLDRLFTVFDSEPDAQRRARHLRDQMAGLGVDAGNVKLDKGDPGDMNQEEAMKLMRELLG